MGIALTLKEGEAEVKMFCYLLRVAFSLSDSRIYGRFDINNSRLVYYAYVILHLCCLCADLGDESSPSSYL